MRKPSSRNWGEFPERQSLSLFAQALLDALFDHTTDSFKAPALNVHSLVLEVRAVARDVVRGKMNEGVLSPLLEELQERIGSCPVLGDYARGALSAYRAELTPKTPALKVLDVSRALASELQGNYWLQLQIRIKSTVRKNIVNREVVDLVNAFVCEAELRGFSREDVYLRTKAYFFASRPLSRRITSVEALDEFLAQFERAEVNYKVTFLGDEKFLGLVDLLAKFGVKVSHELGDVVEGSPESKIVKSGFPVKVEVSGVTAVDCGGARHAAEQRIQFAIDIRRFFSRKSDPKWNGLGLVREELSGKVIRVRPPTPPVFRGSGKKPYVSLDETELIDLFVSSSFDQEAIAKIHGVLQYHRAALDATTPENQLLDLWAAVEGFLPVPGKEAARISHFVAHLLPSLTLSYAQKLFDYIDCEVRSQLGEKSRIIDDAVKQYEHAPAFLRTAALLVCIDLADVRNAVFDLCSENPLLIIRMKRVANSFSCSESARKAVERHRKWIGWHLQRIYSARNRIAHSASRLPYLEALVENLNSYVDLLLRAVVLIGSRSGAQAINIDTAMKMLAVHESGYLEDLKGTARACEISNFRSIVFGRTNPLSPGSNGMLFSSSL